MSSKSWRKDTSVVKRLVEAPYQYGFNQTVRLLERASKFSNTDNSFFSDKPVSRFFQPTAESIRFISDQSLQFNPGEVSSVEQFSNKEKLKEQWKLSVSFIGLTGSQGVLPYHYSEIVLQRNKLKDRSIERFFNLFNHRTVSLFYQASNKYRLPIEYERKKLNPPQKFKTDHHSKLLLSLMGLGTNNLSEQLASSEESLLFYSGLFTQKVRTSTGLRRMLQRHFDVPVSIDEFMGQWQPLIDDVRSRFSSKENPGGQNIALGKSAMLGKQGWSINQKIRITLGPVIQSKAQAFAPGNSALKALDELVRLYLGLEYDYDLVVKLEKDDSLSKTTLTKDTPPTIGWNTWLSGRKKQSADKESLDIKISTKHFNRKTCQV